jgi:hypothetical protein
MPTKRKTSTWTSTPALRKMEMNIMLPEHPRRLDDGNRPMYYYRNRIVVKLAIQHPREEAHQDEGRAIGFTFSIREAEVTRAYLISGTPASMVPTVAKTKNDSAPP